MHLIPLQALSQNMAWSGKRKKTDLYRQYDQDLTIYLHTLDLPKVNKKEKFYLFFEWGIPMLQDNSNGIKIAEDILCKYLGIDDRYNFAVYARKVVTKKKDCYIKFNIFLSEYELLQAITTEL